MALRQIFGSRRGREILSEFDVAVAASGGSIVLTGLILDLTPSQIMQLFSAKRTEIFRPSGRVFTRPWSTEDKLVGLESVLVNPDTGVQAKDLVLADLHGEDLPRILIPAYDYDRERVQFFRSGPRRPRNDEDGLPPLHPQTTLTEAVHATSTAPIQYFDEPAELRGRRFWDGAVSGFHNPVVAGVVDLLERGAERDQVRVLSIGTGTLRLFTEDQADRLRRLEDQVVPDGLVHREGRPKLSRDVVKLASAILGDPPDAASYLAHRMLRTGRPTSPADTPVVRLSPVVRPVFDPATKRWSPPARLGIARTRELFGIGLDAVEPHEFAAVVALGDAWIAAAHEHELPNQGVRQRADMGCDLGSATFRDGLAMWPALEST